METCKIIDYNEQWRERLRLYMLKTFPMFSHTNDYIEYCLNRSLGRVPGIIVINSKGNIVGCHLYYCTKALVYGRVIDTQWGYDTYLDKEYRAEYGFELTLASHSKKGFGLGLTEVNRKIEKKLKQHFFEGVFNYYVVTSKAWKAPFQKLFNLSKELKQVESLKIGKHIFFRTDNTTDINIPHGGFWFNGTRDVDFIRDSQFLKERFINNKVHNYFLFANKSKEFPAYFVVRKTTYRGCPAMVLSDYRYTNELMAPIILRAAKKIALKSNIGVLLFVCGDGNMEDALKHSIYYKTPFDFVTGLKMHPDTTFIVTGADSDAEFLK